MVCVSKRLVRFTAAATFIPFPVLAGEIQIPLDNVLTMTFDQPAKTVYVANPAIADITVIDPRHIFILGKSFGTTNLITLDSSGRETLNQQLIVTERFGRPVTILRGNAGRANMICTPVNCEAAPAPGDGAASSANGSDQAPASSTGGSGSGGGGSGSGGGSGGGGGLSSSAGGIGSSIGQSLAGK